MPQWTIIQILSIQSSNELLCWSNKQKNFQNRIYSDLPLETSLYSKISCMHAFFATAKNGTSHLNRAKLCSRHSLISNLSSTGILHECQARAVGRRGDVEPHPCFLSCRTSSPVLG